MKFQPKDETCKICVCSVEGKDEYCSRRPARNVNECIRMGSITEKFKKNLPFEHERSLSFRIRRDYLWHKDEIPYSSSDYCYRGVSYYTNNEKANETTLAKQMRVISQLEYASRDVCYFCVCPTSGSPPGCIRRNPWFCEYYRIIRRPNYARDRYRYLFKEDRPAYFRQLSFRIRRTMDDGLQELLEHVGDSIEKTECVPFMSEYTDCTEANVCSGCSRCTCTADGTWSCKIVHDCPSNGDDELFDEDTITNAYEVLFNGYLIAIP
ncbi:uncharacterized protein [Battus philenor]|uniref:uncharacterized protein n=1 Tax=Battus philenor TaxID=42288 RepID=UPI0035CFE282